MENISEDEYYACAKNTQLVDYIKKINVYKSNLGKVLTN